MKKIAALFVCLLFLGACSDDDFDENKEKDKLIGTWEGIWETDVETSDVTVIFTDNNLTCYKKDRDTKYVHFFIDGIYDIPKEGIIKYQNKENMPSPGGTTYYSFETDLLNISVYRNLKRKN